MSEDKTLDQAVNETQEPVQAKENQQSDNIGDLVYEAKKHRQDKAKLRQELDELKANIKQRDENELKEKEEYKELSERLSQERDEFKVKAEEYDKFKQETRSSLLEGLSEEEKVIAEDLSLSKLQKFVEMKKESKPVATQESSAGTMALDQDPFKDMNQSERRKNWSKIVHNYSKNSNN